MVCGHSLARRIFGLVLGVSLIVGLGRAALADDKLRVGKAQADAFSFVPLDIGIEQGFFKKHGLDVEASGFAGDAKLQQAIAADAIDIAIGSGLNFAVRLFKMVPSRPSFDAYIARCMARPAFQRAEQLAAG